MIQRTKYVLLLMTSAYVAVSIIAACVDFLLVPSFQEVGHLQVGCYTYDALMVGVRCRGFPGAALAESVLSLPWGQFQVVYVAFDGLLGLLSLGPDELLFVVLAIVASVMLWRQWHTRSGICSGPTGVPNNAMNTDVKHARAFGAHVFAAGYGERWAGKPSR